METAQSRRTVITALVLSLFLHCCILLLFTLQRNNLLDFDPNRMVTSDPDTMPESTDNSWAATKARASQFGAPVIFRDQEDESEEPITQENIEESHETNENSQHMVQEDTQEDKQPPIQQEIDSGTQNSEEKQKTEPDAPIQTTQLANQQLDSQTQKKLKTDIVKKTSSMMHVQKKIKQQQQQTPAIINTKNPLTLAQLAQGFLDHVHDEGNHSITMIGKEGAMPTDEQLKHERYLQKLSWCLQNSFKLNQNRLPSNEPTQATVEIFLALNKDGSLNQLLLAKSCGDFRLDQFTLFVFRDASSSFPPVPRYLTNDPFKIVFMIEINTINNRSMGVYRY